MKKILIVANNKPYVQSLLPDIKAFFEGVAQFTYQETGLPSTPIIKTNGQAIIDPTFFRRFPRHDAYVFITDSNEVEGGYFGYCRLAGGEVGVFNLKEKDRMFVNGKDVGDSNTIIIEHEICHYLYYFYQKTDNTHLYFKEKGEPLSASKELKEIYSQKLNLIQLLWIEIKKLQAELAIIHDMDDPIEIPQSKIPALCEAIKTYEGWTVGTIKNGVRIGGTISWRQSNPGNLRASYFELGKRNGFSYFLNDEVGMKALIHQVTIVCNGKSPTYNKEAKRIYGLNSSQDLTLSQFFSIYAPTFDNNTPEVYAKAMAKMVGILPTVQMRELL